MLQAAFEGQYDYSQRMQTVMALCHFCENHGPRVVMTTQSMRDSTQTECCGPACPISNSVMFPEEGNSYRDRHVDCLMNEVRDDEGRCMACSSFCDGSGLVTADLDAGINYISSQVAVNERVCQLVKHACLRSLSCEVYASMPLQAHTSTMKGTKGISVPTPNARMGNFEDSWLEANVDEGSDGVILFGDDDHGYTLSHTFRLRDAKARGFQRWFSLIVICMDKLLITNNYEFFVSSLSTIIHRLQEQANNVFFMEQSELANECLKQASRASLLPAHFMRNRVTKLELDTSRSLALITANPNIFTKLHKQMTYVLRTQARLCTESVLEGVPTQDALVQLEMERSFDEEMGSELSATDWGIDALQQIVALQFVARRLYHLEQQPLALEALLRQLVTGGQVLVKCDDSSFARQFLIAFAYLLPIGCVHLTYSQRYEHVFKYNLLACPMSMQIPADAGDVVIASVVLDEEIDSAETPQCSSFCDEFSPPPPHSPPSFLDSSCHSDEAANASMDAGSHASSLVLQDFARCRIVRFSAPSSLFVSDSAPAIVTRYKQLLLDNELGSRVLEAVIKNTREQWLSRAKLIYQLSRQKEGIDLKKVLRVVKCTQNDAPVLRFWQAGLSKVYKQHVLNTINSCQQVYL
uniref:Folliculin n=1 Tax=Parascaris univalens TaxID=6257 RepID=A0A915BDN5_PARUN